MTHAITIRPATPADVEALVDLYGALSEEGAHQRDPFVDVDRAGADATEHFTTLLNGDRSVCVLALVADLAIGYLAGYLAPPSSFRPVALARLESIYVRPTWRSQQVGGQLLAAFVPWAQAQGAARISVTAYATNERAIGFYQQYGFTPYTVTLEYAVTSTAAAG